MSKRTVLNMVDGELKEVEVNRFFTLNVEFSDRYWRDDYQLIVDKLFNHLIYEGYKFRVEQETTSETGTCKIEIIREE